MRWRCKSKQGYYKRVAKLFSLSRVSLAGRGLSACDAIFIPATSNRAELGQWWMWDAGGNWFHPMHTGILRKSAKTSEKLPQRDAILGNGKLARNQRALFFEGDGRADSLLMPRTNLHTLSMARQTAGCEMWKMAACICMTTANYSSARASYCVKFILLL